MDVGCGERGRSYRMASRGDANRINGRLASGEPHLWPLGVPDRGVGHLSACGMHRQASLGQSAGAHRIYGGWRRPWLTRPTIILRPWPNLPTRFQATILFLAVGVIRLPWEPSILLPIQASCAITGARLQIEPQSLPDLRDRRHPSAGKRTIPDTPMRNSAEFDAASQTSVINAVRGLSRARG